MWRGVGELASCDGGFKGQTIIVVTTLSPSDDVSPELLMMSPEHERRGAGAWSDQAETHRGDTPSNCGL